MPCFSPCEKIRADQELIKFEFFSNQLNKDEIVNCGGGFVNDEVEIFQPLVVILFIESGRKQFPAQELVRRL